MAGHPARRNRGRRTKRDHRWPFGSKLKSDHYTEAGPRVIRLKNIGDTEFVDAKAHISEAHFSTLQKHRVFPGDIVIAALGENPPRSCLVPEHLGPAIVKADCIRFKAGPRILPKFLNYVLNAPDLRRYAKGIVHGVGRPRLNLGEIKALPIPVPPLPDQRRIVAEIEKQFTRLDAGIAALRRTQANLKRYRAAVLKAACEGRLVPTEAELARKDRQKFESGDALLARVLSDRRQSWQGRHKYKEPAVADSTNLQRLPEGWVWATVEQLAFLDLGFAFKSAEFEASGIRLLRGENLEPGRFRWADTRYWPRSKLEEFKNLLIREGEIVLAMDRPLISSGLKIARARADDVPCLLVQRMARFRPVVEKMTSFLFCALNTDRFIKHLVGGQQGTQLPHISGDGIQSFPIALPPLAEQTRIVAEVERRLSVVDELETVVNANLQRATRLRQSILSQSFRIEPKMPLQGGA